MGQTRDENWNKCKADDPDTSIAGCTALIQANQETTNDLANAYYNRGIAYRDKKDLDSALQDLDKALQLNPNFPSALNSRGNTYADKGENDRAIADYTEAIRQDPNHALAYYNRGNTYDTEGKYDLAIADYNTYAQAGPD